MLRFLICVGMVLLALPAHAASLEATYSVWKTLRAPGTDAVGFRDGYHFLTEHPGWPEEKIIRLRSEAAAFDESPAHGVMEKFCADFPPLSGRGMLACAQAGVGDAATRAAWIKQAWVQGDFNADEEKRILKKHGKKLRRDDHTARLDRLLYEGKLAAAKRQLPQVPVERHNLFRVRIALLSGDKKAPQLVNTLSVAQRRDAGIIFERIRWRLNRNDDAIADLLLAAPKEVPYPELWWPLRARAARAAISTRHYARALALVTHHGNLSGEARAEALWLNGWLHLRHRGDAATAYKAFFTLYTSVNTPVSKARAAYWAARAAEKNGNPGIAGEWLEKAARHPTVFYGQLALARLKPKAPLALPAPPAATDAQRQQFDADPRVRMVRRLAADGDEKMRDLFLTGLGLRLNGDGPLALLAELAADVGGVTGGVEAAKLALRNAVVMIPHGWPRLELPEGLGIEPALALAITRQESEFNADAQSPAGARGLMQLLPTTARQVARRLDMPYRPAMLTDRAINLTLGSRYLGQIIDGFDGSYVLGIASYNAGPGNVRQWIAAQGKPPENLHGAIDWIESIPFGETRNYVMRVLENVGVYRAITTPDAPLAIEADVLR
ncbi:MAG: lytic transglycosylase domain-containing protein [Alphaproteobacteria bacterium]|nr:lytic transglycosylase domain-containing protein [Alphaproteobacteria bacterium]